MREWRIITRNSDGSKSNLVVWVRLKWQAAAIATEKVTGRGVQVTEIVKAYVIA